METSPKFSIGSRVYILKDSKAYMVEIESVKTVCGTICYKIKSKHGEWVREEELFASKFEVIDYVLSEVI